MMLMFPFMAMLRTVITSISLFIYVSIQLLKVFKNLALDLFIWTRYFFFLLIYNVHCFLEHMFLPILYLIWWINLCVCCAKECHQKKATTLTLKTSKSRRVVPYGKNLCLFDVPRVLPPFLNSNLYVFGVTKKSPVFDFCTALDCLKALMIFPTCLISLSSLGLNLY